MEFPYPPLSCKTAYIHDGEILVVPFGASLGTCCIQCGSPASTWTVRTFHWPLWKPNFFGPWLAVSFLVFVFKRLLHLDQRIRLTIPLCRAHRLKQMQRRWVGLALAATGFAILPFTAKLFEVRNWIEGLLWGGTLALIVGGLLIAFLGFHILDLVYLDDRISAYTGSGLEFMEKAPSETANATTP